MNKSMTAFLAVLAVALTTAAAPIERKTVSLELANDLATAAIASCRAIGRNAVVAIVDRGGNLVALQRGDDVGPHNTRAAERKAFTALSTKTRTTVLAERAASDPTSRNLTTVADLLLLGGGVPLIIDGDALGAIGVAGSGGATNDDQCATSAINSVLPAALPQP